MSISRVALTEPSIEFSIGTIPLDTLSSSTARITSSTVPYGIKSSFLNPAMYKRASSEKVPSGPK